MTGELVERQKTWRQGRRTPMTDAEELSLRFVRERMLIWTVTWLVRREG